MFLDEFHISHRSIESDYPYSRRVKRKWIKEGYRNQMSFYGVVTHEETEESEFRRIEILSNTAFNERIVSTLYNWFKRFPPPVSYTIWLYDKNMEGAVLVGEFGR